MDNWFVDEARVSHSWRGFELRINRIAFFPFLGLSRGRGLASVLVTSDQARALDHLVATDLEDPHGIYTPVDGVDECGHEWSDGRFVAIHCRRCARRILASTWPVEAEKEHAMSCDARA